MDSFSGAITRRYDGLSKQECCLSCGKALSFAPVKRGDVCVDLGCGQGNDAMRMAILTGEQGRVYGIDLSDGMLYAARDYAARFSLDNAVFINSPFEQLSLDDSLADIVISNCAINHSRDQGAVWKEIARILKPGGCFVVSDIYALEAVPAEYANDPVAVSECWAGAVTLDEYIRNITNAGLAELEMPEESVPYEKGKVRVASFTIRGEKPSNGENKPCK